jgi:tetratricopeptide (TPR) repeat protein
MALSVALGNLFEKVSPGDSKLQISWLDAEWDAAQEVLGPRARWHINRGVALANAGRFDEAIVAYERALARNPNLVVGHVFRAFALAEAGRTDEAIAAADRAVQLAPDNMLGYGTRGLVYRKAGRPVEAVTDYRRAVELDPTFKVEFLADALFDAGSFDEAAAVYDDALKSTAENDQHPLRVKRSVALLGAKRFDEAIAALENAIEFGAGPQNKSALHFLRGQFLRNGGRLDEAIAAYAYTLTISKSDTDFSHIVGEICEELNLISTELLEKSSSITYNRKMNQADRLHAAADLLREGFPAERVDRALAYLAADDAALEMTERAPGTPRLKWDKDALADENPAHFTWRAYQAEAQGGTLHQGLIYDEDRELYRRLRSWLRSHPMPEGIDIPTKRDWITREIEAGHAKPAPAPQRPRTEGQRLHEAARDRRYRARHPRM